MLISSRCESECWTGLQRLDPNSFKLFYPGQTIPRKLHQSLLRTHTKLRLVETVSIVALHCPNIETCRFQLTSPQLNPSLVHKPLLPFTIASIPVPNSQTVSCTKPQLQNGRRWSSSYSSRPSKTLRSQFDNSYTTKRELVSFNSSTSFRSQHCALPTTNSRACERGS